ncbi:UNVERIFIED_CONTAM: RpS4 [Trichonephila clavipes]
MKISNLLRFYFLKNGDTEMATAAPHPSAGPHKLRESLPLVIMLRNRLKYALTNTEVTKIVMQRLIKVDGKVRTDRNFPAGFMVFPVFVNHVLVSNAIK